MNTLIWVEHDNASVKDATLAVVTAAAKLGEVTALVAGSGCDGAAQAGEARPRATARARVASFIENSRA